MAKKTKSTSNDKKKQTETDNAVNLGKNTEPSGPERSKSGDDSGEPKLDTTTASKSREDKSAAMEDDIPEPANEVIPVPSPTGSTLLPESGDPTPSEARSGESPFERAITVWSEIDLTRLQKALDEEGIQMVENQKGSVVGRKELAGRTKEFKKLTDEEKLVEIKALLKLYQTEVDNLTNRGKYAENCFMNVYKLLAEAPDPKPLLEASIDSVLSASEASKLSAVNAKLNDLVSRHADYDQIKAKLMKVEMQAIESSRAKVKAKEAEMRALVDEKERTWLAKEQQLNEQISELKTSFKVTQAQLQSGSKVEDVSGGRFAELELVQRDLERANSRTVELEKRNQELRTDLEQLKSGGSKDLDEKAQLQKQYENLEGENAILGARIESVRSDLERKRAVDHKKLQSLERDLANRSAEVESLNKKLANQEDYDQLKRELQVLKSIEFQDDGGEQEAAEQKSAKDERLEKRLLERNKKLNSDMTMLRLVNSDLSTELEGYKTKVSTLEDELKVSKQLTSKLESDLTTVRDSDTASIAGGSVATRPGRLSSPTSSIIGGYSGDARSGRGQPAVSSAGSDKSILPIITQQRDRFRQRNSELEQELSSAFQKTASLQKELESVKRDNVQLYERTRYASAYTRPGPSGASAGVEDRYKDVYEEGLSPFQQFKGRETERVLSRMGPFERVTYSFTRAILANRATRNLFMIYCLCLHVLVMVIVSHSVGASASVPEMHPLDPITATTTTTNPIVAPEPE